MGAESRAHPPDAVPPLAGYSVAVAADCRRHPVADILGGLGARVTGVQAIRSVPQPDERLLRAATERALTAPCDELVISSGGGLRTWLAAARRWGLAADLIDRFAGARVLARDGRAADELRELGLTVIWSTAGASTEELFRYLAAQRPSDRRIVAQLDRASLREPAQNLARTGADLVEVPTYRTLPPSHVGILRRLVDLVTRRQVDAVMLLGEPAATHLLAQAAEYGRVDELLNALCDDVRGACLGPLTAAHLAARGVRPLLGTGPYVEELTDALAIALPRFATRLRINGTEVEIRGHAVVLDGRVVPIQSGPMAVLRALARSPGRVLSCAEIRRFVPDGSTVDDHAIEMAVLRLRRSLVGTDLIQTVMRRGYRLAA
ncbi:uroporphyrinogen-III synthase [Virgisporangium aurantiacum]|uniref:Uroporphyrinogen-III synthase n=1 Tax=Virgisporangium aurantiacum TaxID=175570 RepID=A0A8J3ZJ24_9ACTN|nr:uroporphyrinogen-III synthase [Virgisporangium aurantiacum]GIJ62436.1 uroporphyrinogen-III synthase [Virgisporangium aurantiacum]